MNAALSFNHLTFGYRAGAPVLEDVSLVIQPGSVTGLLGPNGAGKTTLLHLALGWLRPTAGRVELDGRPLGTYGRQELGRRMGLVPQSENIAFDYSVLEYVLLGRAPYLPPLEMPGPEDVSAALRALERVGIVDLAERSMLEISGGERQLALTARSLAQQPDLLLLDEPTAHLDLGNKARLVSILRSLNEQGVTILLTTHDPEMASLLCTHLVLIEKGRPLAAGPVEEMLTPENLSRLYGLPVELESVRGKKVVFWE